MVNTQDKGQDYYPQSKQGEREGKPEVYSRNAQLPSAPDQTSSTLKPTKAQPGTFDPAKHSPITSQSKSSQDTSSDSSTISSGNLAQRTLPSTNYYTSRAFLIPLGAGFAGYAGTNMLARSLPPGSRMAAALAGGAVASFLASRYC